MATLKLPRKTARAPADPTKPRPPVRGAAAPRKRPTLAESQAERAERAERAAKAEAAPPRRERPREAAAEREPARDRKPARRDGAATTKPARDASRGQAGARGTGAGRGQTARRAEPTAQGRDAPRRRDTPPTQGPGRAQRPQDRPPPPASRASKARPPAERGTPRTANPQERTRPTTRPAKAKAPTPPRHGTRPPAATGARLAQPAPPPARPRPQERPRRPTPAAERTVPATPASPTHPEGERLSKRMTTLGLASRREADEWIEAGWVRADGRVAVLGQRVGPDARIEIDPRAYGQQAQRVTILLHKPVGYVSGQAEDGYENAATLVRPENQWAGDRSGTRFHRGHLRGLAPAGRLDIDSTGLLVLTQDGRVARLLIGDEARVEKEYLVRVQSTRPEGVGEADLDLLRHGLELDGQPLRPAKVSWQNEDQLRFVLREGRKRQIRRMCEAVGLKVLGLKRVRIGSVVLGQLPAGQWRFLEPHERFA